MAERRGLKAVTRQVLLRLETGKTKYPSREVLRDVAELYELNYDSLVQRVIEHAYGVTVPTPRVIEDSDVTHVEVLSDPIAAGLPLKIDARRVEEVPVPFPTAWLLERGITEPWCVRVGDDERSMAGTIDPGEIVLLDCSDERRISPVTDQIYAINDDDGTGFFGGTLKRLVVVGVEVADDRSDDVISAINRQFWLVSDNPDKQTYRTRPLMLQPGQLIQSRLVGRVMWHGQPI